MGDRKGGGCLALGPSMRWLGTFDFGGVGDADEAPLRPMAKLQALSTSRYFHSSP